LVEVINTSSGQASSNYISVNQIAYAGGRTIKLWDPSGTNWIVTPGVALADGVWHHLAFTYVGTTVSLFANGVSAGSGTLSPRVTTGDVPTAQLNFPNSNAYFDDITLSNEVKYSGSTYTVPGGAAALATIALVCPTPYTRLLNPGTIAVVSPVAQISATFGGGGGGISSPTPTLLVAGHESIGENSLAAVSPMPTLVTGSGAVTTLTAPTNTFSITGTFTGFGAAPLTAPVSVVAAAGTVSVMGRGQVTGPMPNLVGYSGAVLSITTSSATIAASGTSGSISGVSLTLPLFDLAVSGTSRTQAYADLISPAARLGAQAQAWLIAPGAQLTAVGTAVVAVTYEAYALNLNHTPRRGEEPVDELTHFTNYPFDRIVRYKNSYFGMNSTGLYLLEGTTDLAAPVAWSMQTAFSDFDSPNLKTLSMAYFGGRFGPVTTIELLVGEANTESYIYTTPLDATAKNYRQPFGRGAKARYYALAASGSNEMTVDSIVFNIDTLLRRI
jgi:hypothetical protein